MSSMDAHELKEQLIAAITAEAKEEWMDDALSHICGEFCREEWTPADMEQAFQSVSRAVGGDEAARVLVLYLMGWMLATERCKAYLCPSDGGDPWQIATKEELASDMMEEERVWVGDLKLVGAHN